MKNFTNYNLTEQRRGKTTKQTKKSQTLLLQDTQILDLYAHNKHVNNTVWTQLLSSLKCCHTEHIWGHFEFSYFNSLGCDLFCFAFFFVKKFSPPRHNVSGTTTAFFFPH